MIQDDIAFLLQSPQDIMRDIARRAKQVRLEQNITQQTLADRVGIAIGTVKRFEKTGEIQFNHLLRIALVLDRLGDFQALFAPQDKPKSLFNMKEPTTRKRAREK